MFTCVSIKILIADFLAQSALYDSMRFVRKEDFISLFDDAQQTVRAKNDSIIVFERSTNKHVNNYVFKEKANAFTSVSGCSGSL